MAIITSALLTALHTGYRRDYQQGFDAIRAQSMWREVAMEVPSITRSNTYGWLGEFPGFREWIGERVVKDIKASAYQIENKSFEMTVGVDRDDIQDDLMGTYSPMMRRMGEAAAVHADELLFPLIKTAHATLCYDGQNFFDTDHPVAANADGTGAVTSVSNVTAGAGTPWYVLASGGAIKPFIVQTRKAPEFVTKFDPRSSDHVFMNKEFLWGVDDRLNVGLGLWQLAHRSQAALNPDNVYAVVQAMMSLKGDGGRPLNVRPNILLVPPTLLGAANKTVMAQQGDSGASNTAYQLLQVRVAPWLA
jgi:phage major head subunit gpT-like protein